VQNAVQHSVQAVIRTLQTSCSAALAHHDNNMNGSKQVADLRDIDKRISGKMADVSKAIAQNDPASPALIEASTEAVRMLKQKYDAQQGLGGLVRSLPCPTQLLLLLLLHHLHDPFGGPTECSSGPAIGRCSTQDAAVLSESKAATQSLARVLESQLMSEASRSSGRTSTLSTNARDIALIDANISKLSARIRGLEVDLQDSRSELHAAQMRRATLEKPVGRGAPLPTTPDGTDRARTLAKRLDVQFTAALWGGAVVGQSEETLHTLLDSCHRCALLHDKHMERLAEQLDFALHRAAAATNLGDQLKRDAANKMVVDLRGQSSRTHDAATRLEHLVESLDGNINKSSLFSTLRPISMQVKQILWKVHSAHNVLSTSDQPGACCTVVPGGKKAMTMEEILHANVKATSTPRRQPTAQVPVTPVVVPVPVTPARPQQVVAPQPVPVPRAPAPFSTARPQVHSASHGLLPGIMAYSAIAAPRPGTLSAPLPLAEPVPAPAKQVPASPVDALSHTVLPQGPRPCSMPDAAAPVYAAQPAAAQQEQQQPADASHAAGTSYSNPVLMAAEDAAARLRMTFGQAASQAPAAGRGLPGRAGGRGRGRYPRPARA
jgi:hypothetical protein